MAGLYGFSDDRKKIGNWAGHSHVPSHMRAESLGHLDARPSHMRSGFFPDHLSVDNALGEVRNVMPNYLPFELGQAEPVQNGGRIAAFVENLKEHPYALIFVGIVLGVVVTKAMRS